MFYLLYLPFCISFNSEVTWVLLVFDIMSYSIYVFDIFVSLNSSILTEFGNYIHSSEEITKNYYNKFLVLDLLAIVPCDLFAIAFGLSPYVTIITKAVRLFKLKKIQEIYVLMRSKAKYPLSSIRIILYVPIIIYLTHLIACLFF